MPVIEWALTKHQKVMMSHIPKHIPVAFLAFFMFTACNKKKDATPDSGPYFAKVKTIIQNNCLSCHSSSGSWAGRPVAFDSDSAIAFQYAAIKAAVNDPVTPTNKRMPEVGSLSAADIDIIVKWYNKGGKTTD